jgi:hypothetical protein
MTKILPDCAVSKHFDRVGAYFLAALTLGLVIQIAPRLLTEVLR